MASLDMSAVSTKSRNPEDRFRILVATDIHLGYAEKNQTLTDDSFNSFEEILQIANSREVDMILLGGDLFHDPTPSQNSLNKCIKLLRTYVLGDKPIDFEFLSDQNQNFPDSFSSSVNYEDMNLNVSIPVFSIHGNHDDISGIGRLSSMDILSSTGLLNYFGKWRDLSKIEISPIVLKKNNTKVALYGLSHVHDARLARLFRDKLVNIQKPDIPDSEIFNLMVLHQNRADRGRFNFLPEDKLPGFLDLIVWGHEHDCRIEPEANGRTNAFITQPGSSVATSLSEGEAIEKNVGILDICEKEFKLNAVKLKTVRPFIFRSLNIEDYVEDLRLNEGNTQKKVEEFYCKNINEMIEESKKKLTGHPKQPTLPLIRLRITYTNESFSFNTSRFGHKYEKLIANPESLLAFKKNFKKTKTSGYNPDENALKTAFDKKDQQDKVEDVVEAYFNELENEDDMLKLFNLKSLTEVCRLFVEKTDDAGSLTIIKKHFEKSIKFMEEKMANEDNIPETIREFQSTKSKEALTEAVIENSKVQDSKTQQSAIDVDEDDEMDTSSASTAAKGKGRARGAATKAGRGRGKATAAATNDSSSSVSSLNLKKTTQQTKRGKAKIDTVYIDDSDSD